MNQYLLYFVAARITRASAALGELALLIPRYRAEELINSIGHFCLLHFVHGTC